MMPLERKADLDLARTLNSIKYHQGGKKVVVSIYPLKIL